MTLLVDTSVWSLALRRDSDLAAPQVEALRAALEGGVTIVTTGLILQELLQGFAGPKAHKQLVENFPLCQCWSQIATITLVPPNYATDAGAQESGSGR